MKKFLTILGILVLIVILFKGAIYRSVVNYDKVGTRKHIPITNQKLIKKIDEKVLGKEMKLEVIIGIANTITANEVGFTTKSVSSDPNIVIQSNKANCIGYAAMFNSIVYYLLEKNELDTKFEVSHHIGKLDILGVDIHQYFRTSFFNDHDYNEIKEVKTGLKITVDPSVNDYLGIESVTEK